MKTQKKWSNEEIKILLEIYPKFDRYYCSKILNCTVEQIVYKIRKLNIRKDKSLDFNQFKKITGVHIPYILGFMWSDGYISNDGRHFNVTGVVEDINKIEFLFDKVGNWCKHIDNREKYGWKNAKTIIGSNKEIYNFLVENDYKDKSFKSADKILSLIPDDLKHYFFRGLIDGDGCFYYYKPKKGSTLRQFILTSTYEQDWSYFVSLCNELEIKYTIKRNKNDKQSSSVIRITNKEGIIKLGEYIYNGEMFGLNRKFDKYKIIKDS